MQEILHRLDVLRGGIRQSRTLTFSQADELLDLLQKLVVTLIKREEERQ
jgi:hypothetical protein